MQQWMSREADQFQQTSALVSRLADHGFTPISTVPTQDAEVRRDHTLAIIQRLASWSSASFEYPLRVFSSGPVFAHGSWADSLDIEVLEDPVKQASDIIFDLLANLVCDRFGAEDRAPLVFVVGHVGLVQALLSAMGWSSDEVARLQRAFAEGRFADGEAMVAERVPDLLPLFRPCPPDQALSLLNQAREKSPAADIARWQAELPQHLDHIPTVLWDLSLTGSWAYYSGLVFSLYARGQGEALVKGGRFSVHHQDRDWQGIGFTIMVREWFAGSDGGGSINEPPV